MMDVIFNEDIQYSNIVQWFTKKKQRVPSLSVYSEKVIVKVK